MRKHTKLSSIPLSTFLLLLPTTMHIQVNKLLNPLEGNLPSQQQHLGAQLPHVPLPQRAQSAAAKTLETLNQENANLKDRVEQLTVKVHLNAIQSNKARQDKRFFCS